MEFPNGSELLRAALVVGILKSQANHLYRDRLGEVVAARRNRYSIAGEASNLVLPGRAVWSVARRLHHHSGGVWIRRVGDLDVDIAIVRYQPDELRVRSRNMEHQQLIASPGSIRRRIRTGGPLEDLSHGYVLRSGSRQSNVFGQVAVISAVRSGRRAVANVC